MAAGMHLSAAKANKSKMDDVLKRRFFFAPAFEIYGGERGLFDLGPIGCGVKNNILAAWRQHFVVAENMFEVDCTALTPLAVLKASGHVDRFKDVMVRDLGTGECFRADHLLEDVMGERLKDPKLDAALAAEYATVQNDAGNYTTAQLKEAFAKYAIPSPAGNTLSEPEDFNMMFETTMGPRAAADAPVAGAKSNVGFLRPETAQGIFLCFPRLYDFNGARLPFAAAQIGPAFRNEIAPRNGLLRVREFTMAEIEHFLDPLDKAYPKFATVKDQLLPLLPRDEQVPGAKATLRPIGEAVASKMVDNETLGYYLARIYAFLLSVGVKAEGIRFRQHRSDEMAHYAQDCWDAEIETSFGWIECVGCADRSAYDLTHHSAASGKPMVAQVKLDEPVIETVLVVEPNKKVMGPKLKTAPKGALKELSDKFEQFSSAEAAEFQAQLAAAGVVVVPVPGGSVDVTPDMVSIAPVERKTFVRTFQPSVIEPSFGIGRVMYALFEHSFAMRDGDETRGWMRLPPRIAPLKVALLPLMTNNAVKYAAILDKIADDLRARGITYRIDDSGASVGRRYCRFDEIGTPFAVTADPSSINEADEGKPVTVTLRDRDSMGQVRLPVAELGGLLADLCNAVVAWDAVVAKYGLVEVAVDNE